MCRDKRRENGLKNWQERREIRWNMNKLEGEVTRSIKLKKKENMRLVNERERKCKSYNENIYK